MGLQVGLGDETSVFAVEVCRFPEAKDAVLRNKWKYLRDQFNVEFGKIKPPCSGDPGGKSYEKKMSSL